MPTSTASLPSLPANASTVAYLGPEATFTEAALLAEADLAGLERVSLATILDVIHATEAGTVDLGFVPIENAIEGSVTATIDTLAFDSNLLIQREVVIDVHLNLLGVKGTSLEEVAEVASYQVATAQCRRFLSDATPHANIVNANSTAEAARLVAEAGDPKRAAIGTALAASVYGLDILVPNIEDHTGNQTRFVLIATNGIPAPTGHDKTTVVVFQRADAPGSLLSILQEFAARSINLSKLESRPTKTALGDYCFIIDLDGHIQDEVVADCLRNLKSKQSDVRFLGSYPAASSNGAEIREASSLAWAQAGEWIQSLRARVQP